MSDADGEMHQLLLTEIRLNRKSIQQLEREMRYNLLKLVFMALSSGALGSGLIKLLGDI